MKRFLKKIKKTNDCWLWTGAKDANGYGKFSYKYKVIYAHRMSWILSNGEIQRGLYICHKCDNPTCVRIDHLFIGTPSDNCLDMKIKGRAAGFFISNPPVGEKNVNARINSLIAKKIKKHFAKGFTNNEIARKFGVSKHIVSRIKTGKAWAKHV